MTDFNFFSEDRYIYLPSKQDPKVILAITTSAIAKKSFELYNPFSKKAKLFKSVCQFVLVHFNNLIPSIINIQKHKKSEFVKHLEKQLNTPLSISIYRSTDKNKIILQLVSKNEIHGYLKFPLNEKGIRLIENETKAIKLLYNKQLTPSYSFSGNYKETPFFIVPNIEGEIKKLPEKNIEGILKGFEKSKEFLLSEHPRIKGIQKKIKTLNLKEYNSKLDRIITNSTNYYKETLEHGDFTPWNIITTSSGPILFDFEFFEERGIVYFDLIKYHFQVGRLLKKQSYIALTDYIIKKIKHPEIKPIICLFLIKEIIRMKELEELHDFEKNMLNYICE